jgi:hypothetical protein
MRIKNIAGKTGEESGMCELYKYSVVLCKGNLKKRSHFVVHGISQFFG